jgi:hypothetical protein
VDGSRARASADATEPVEQRHLAEELAPLHQREHRLAAVVRLAGQGHAAVLDHVEVVGLRALLEEHVAAAQLERLRLGQHPVEASSSSSANISVA